jgi:putative flippase GtrA
MRADLSQSKWQLQLNLLLAGLLLSLSSLVLLALLFVALISHASVVAVLTPATGQFSCFCCLFWLLLSIESTSCRFLHG